MNSWVFHGKLDSLLDCRWNIQPLSPTTSILCLPCASEMQTHCVTSGVPACELWDLFPVSKTDSIIANIYWRRETKQNTCLIWTYRDYIRKLSLITVSFFSLLHTLCLRERELWAGSSSFMSLLWGSGQKIMYFVLSLLLARRESSFFCCCFLFN